MTSKLIKLETKLETKQQIKEITESHIVSILKFYKVYFHAGRYYQAYNKSSIDFNLILKNLILKNNYMENGELYYSSDFSGLYIGYLFKEDNEIYLFITDNWDLEYDINQFHKRTKSYKSTFEILSL